MCRRLVKNQQSLLVWVSCLKNLDCILHLGEELLAVPPCISIRTWILYLPSPTDSTWSPSGHHDSISTPSGKDLNLPLCINPSGVHMDFTWNPSVLQMEFTYSSSPAQMLHPMSVLSTPLLIPVESRNSSTKEENPQK